MLCHTHGVGGGEVGKPVETGFEELKALHTKLRNSIHPHTSIRYRSETGLPATIINRVAFAGQPSLVITGLITQSGHGKWLTGGGEAQTVTDTCLCPVLLVPARAYCPC